MRCKYCGLYLLPDLFNRRKVCSSCRIFYKLNWKGESFEKVVKMQKVNFILFVFCIFLISFFFLLGIVLFLGVSFGPQFSYKSISEIIATNSYQKAAIDFQDSQATKSLAYLCSLRGDDLDKVNCVVDFTCPRYDYVLHDRHTNILRENPEQFFKIGGICRDIAVFYSATFNLLNITNDYVIVPYHIYNKVSLEDGNYTVDACDIVRLND